jgi:ADP-ribose pyrophosphatase
MSSEPSQPDDGSLWVKILDLAEDYSFGKLFRIVRATLQYRRFDGRMSDPVTRINFERGDSVGVLLYDPRDDAVILVRQFRYPVYASLAAAERGGDSAKQAWILEIVAGVKDFGRTVKDVAHKELLEEAGYAVVGELQPIATICPSPGGTSERIHLFLGEVDQRQHAGKGGGVAAEGEDIQIVVLPFHEAMDMVARGEISDAKTIIALQHLALLKAGKAGRGVVSGGL